MSKRMKWGVGCGLTAVILIILVCGGIITLGFLGYRWIMEEVDAFAAPFEEQGYVRVEGQLIEVNTEIVEPTLYLGQAVKIHTDTQNSIAIACQAAEVYGTVNGDLDFLGQVLMIKPGAVVTGNVNVKFAQSVIVEGTVEGEITGKFQTLSGSGAKPALENSEEEQPPYDSENEAPDETGEGGG